MTRFRVSSGLLVVVLAILAAVPALAQRRDRERIRPTYDRAAETTVDGKVKEVVEKSTDAWTGLHLKLETDDRALEVLLGPAEWVEEQGFDFAVGDEIEVTGAPVELDGAESLVARIVVKGEATLELRDEEGRPFWAPPRRRND